MNMIMALVLVVASWAVTMGQHVELGQPLFDRVEPVDVVPDGLLAGKSVVLYDPVLYTDKDLRKMQQTFQRTGIDAVAYFTFDMVLANPDATQSAARYFSDRSISFITLARRTASSVTLLFTRFSGDANLIDMNQPAWRVTGSDLTQLLQQMYRTAVQSQPKQNFLINDVPESDFVVSVTRGRSFNAFPSDLKVDRLAVPLLGNPMLDSALVSVFRTKYSLPFDIVKAGTDFSTLREQHFLYVLKHVHAREYTIRKMLKIPDVVGEEADRVGPMVYMFYVQNLISGHLFLGTTQDVDVDMKTSLLNYINALKENLGL